MSKKNRDNDRARRAAEIQAAQARKERNKRVALIGGIVVVLGAIVAAVTVYSSSGGSADKADYSSVTLAAGDASIKLGDDSAPVKVVIYEDFLCPYCRQLENSTRDFLRENAAKGKVQVEYRPVNILTQSTYSARAMNAWAAVLQHAAPKAAMTLHDLFYDHQPYEQSADKTTDADIAELVKEAGGDNSAVTAAMKTKDTAFFDASAKAAQEANLTGTPTVYINGKDQTGMSVDQLVSAIENAVTAG